MSTRKAKFKVGLVVMVRDQVSDYPVKLVKRTYIGTAEVGTAWFDTLGNIEYEKRMRPLTHREIGLPRSKGAKR